MLTHSIIIKKKRWSRLDTARQEERDESAAASRREGDCCF